MRNALRVSVCGSLLIAAVPLALGGVVGCKRRGLSDDGGVGVIVGSGGAGGQGTTGVGGGAGIAAACEGASDPRLVIADQRILRLTENETLNTVRALFGSAEADALVSDAIFTGDPRQWRFPPLLDNSISTEQLPFILLVADHIAAYVLANFATVTGCAAATDACASAYLDKLAARAYRRALTPEEQAHFTALYTKLRSTQTVNGYEVTFTVEEATSYAVNALVSSPQMLWRWELGDPAMASAAPAGVPLTDQELATHLSFFLTDQPPDATLAAAADAGTLRANLPAHGNRLLSTPAARDWLRTIVEINFGINWLPGVQIDRARFPVFTPALVGDMAVETRMFLDDVLWNGNLTDLLVSRTTFLNTNLASNIYMVAAPAGATATSFVQTTLPADKRAGLLTNAGFLTTRARATGVGLVPRALAVNALLVCVPVPPPPDTSPPQLPPGMSIDQQTAQEQVAARAAVPLCNTCHALFDAYGLALDNYDVVGRYRTTDDLGKPVDAHTTLPAAIGGGAVANGVELAEALAANPLFTNCMARMMLQYAMATASSWVEAPLPPQQAGCATADLVQKYQSAGGKTFTDLVRATAAAPAFALRRAAR